MKKYVPLFPKNQQCYAIYGREHTGGRFLPLDYSAGALVTNKIYMTIFTEAEYDRLVTAVDYLNRENPEFEFEIRTIKQSNPTNNGDYALQRSVG